MDISDLAAVTFSNEQIRPLADALARVFKLAKQTAFLYNAKGMPALFPNDPSVILDGSATDGRTAISGADVNAIIAIAEAQVADFEANGFAKISQIGKVAVNF